MDASRPTLGLGVDASTPNPKFGMGLVTGLAHAQGKGKAVKIYLFFLSSYSF
jgi:hypothetical protein